MGYHSTNHRTAYAEGNWQAVKERPKNKPFQRLYRSLAMETVPKVYATDFLLIAGKTELDKGEVQ